MNKRETPDRLMKLGVPKEYAHLIARLRENQSQPDRVSVQDSLYEFRLFVSSPKD